MAKQNKKATRQEEHRAQLREVGLRVTMARLAVLEQLEEASRPLSHAELAEVLEPRGFDKATVYRNLIDLTEVELASRAELGDHVWRFELRRHAQHHSTAHPHFVCVDCGQVTCLGEAEVRLNPLPGSANSAISSLTEVLLKGHCRACA